MRTIILAVFLGLVLLFGCVGQTNTAPTSSGNNQPSGQQANNNPTTETCTDLPCYYQQAIKNKDITQCDKMSGSGIYGGVSYSKDMCYTGLAKELQDTSICKNLSDEGYLVESAKCYAEIAIKKNDVSICLVDNSIVKDECLTNFAITYKDANICSQVRLLARKQSACITSLAIVAGDKTICNNVPDEDWKSLCQRFVDEGSNNNPIICSDTGLVDEIISKYCKK
jgi:hypothetical protein